ncbi:MAG: hypothetical protein OEZ15_08690 [Gammaproteobacteria bacterium]|nr:hypothetical protein [Gammaproteobacteria bacterium]
MHKFVIQYCAIALVLLSLPAVSYSQSSYKIEIGAELSKENQNTSDNKNTLLSAQIFFDEVTIGSHPYAEAAFLEQTSSIGIGYSNFDITSNAFDFSGDQIIFGVDYVLPDSLIILQGGITSADGDYKNGLKGGFDADGIFIGIGKYITENSAITIRYLQLDGDANFVPSIKITSKLTEIGVDYKIVEELRDGAAFKFEASFTSSDMDMDTTSETNTIIEFSGDYYQNQSISIGASLEINSGDDKGSEGKTFGLNLGMFLTPVFAIAVEFNQFMADNTSVDDSDEVVLVGAVRF